MKRISTVLLLFSIAIFLTACSSDGGVEISCDEFYENEHQTAEIKFGVGEEFTLTLCSNPTTGFLWSEEADISNGEILQQVSHEFVAPGNEDNPPPPGSPGQEIWTFTALKGGSGTISLEYSRPWEGGEKGEWTFTLTVNVE